MRWSVLVLAGALVAGGGASAPAQVFHSSAGDLVVQTAAKELDHPWALAFLPDGRMLVTERPGRMRIVGRDGTPSPALAGVPQVFASGQGGLLDVVLDRGFAQNHAIYFCYAEPAEGRARTALARARVIDEGTLRIDAVQVIFRQAGPLSSGNHFGCRIVQTPDDNLFLTTGDHFTTRDQASASGRTARSHRTIPSSATLRPSRRSGATGIAIPRASPFTPPPASYGSTSTARAGATRSTSSRRARITAGR